MTPNQTDILAALRSSGEAGDLLCLHAAAEIKRLRLTDEEREAVELVAEAYSDKAADAYAHNEDDQHYSQIAATLRGLLERMK
jgi:hypothetical protein